MFLLPLPVPPTVSVFIVAGGPGLHGPRDEQRPGGAGHVGRGQRSGAEHRPRLYGVLQPSLGPQLTGVGIDVPTLGHLK